MVKIDKKWKLKGMIIGLLIGIWSLPFLSNATSQLGQSNVPIQGDLVPETRKIPESLKESESIKESTEEKKDPFEDTILREKRKVNQREVEKRVASVKTGDHQAFVFYMVTMIGSLLILGSFFILKNGR